MELTNKDFADEYLDIIEEIVRFRSNVDHTNSKLVYSVIDFEDYLSNFYIVDKKLKKAILRVDLDLIAYLFNLLYVLEIGIDKSTKDEIIRMLNDEVYYKHYLRRDGENRIMTIHSSKGLEAENVFVRIAKNPYKIDDEYRRKLFVAFSRAKSNLYISYKDCNIVSSPLDNLLRKNLRILNSHLQGD